MVEVKIEEEKYDGHILSVTHNGYYWTSISLKTLEELNNVANAISDYIDQENKKALESDETSGDR